VIEPIVPVKLWCKAGQTWNKQAQAHRHRRSGNGRTPDFYAVRMEITVIEKREEFIAYYEPRDMSVPVSPAPRSS
jgi:hypothetical protein